MFNNMDTATAIVIVGCALMIALAGYFILSSLGFSFKRRESGSQSTAEAGSTTGSPTTSSLSFLLKLFVWLVAVPSMLSFAGCVGCIWYGAVTYQYEPPDNLRRAEVEEPAKPGLDADTARKITYNVTQEPLARGWQTCQSEEKVRFDRAKPQRNHFFVNAAYASKMTYVVLAGGPSLGYGKIALQRGLGDPDPHIAPDSSRWGTEVTVKLDGGPSVIHAIRSGPQKKEGDYDQIVVFEPTVHEPTDKAIIRTEKVCQPGELNVWGLVPLVAERSSEVTIAFLDTITGDYIPAENFLGKSAPIIGFAKVDPDSEDLQAGSYEDVVTRALFTVTNVQKKAVEGDQLVIMLPVNFPRETRILVNWKIE